MAIWSAIHDRLEGMNPTRSVYGVVPRGEEISAKPPYIAFGRGGGSLSTESKFKRGWSISITINAFSSGHDSLSEISTMVEEIVAAATVDPLSPAGGWEVLSCEVVSAEVSEVFHDEFGPSMAGNVVLRLEVEDNG